MLVGAATLLATAASGAVDDPPARAYTVEELAGVVGCSPTFAGHPSDFRQASCTVGGAHVVLLDFRTTEGQRDWLAEAVAYGVPYLAGDRWVLGGRSRDYLISLRERLGGAIEEDTEMDMPMRGH